MGQYQLMKEYEKTRPKNFPDSYNCRFNSCWPGIIEKKEWA